MFAPKEYWDKWEAKDFTNIPQTEIKTLKKELINQGWTVATKRYNFIDLSRCYAYRLIAMKDKTGTKTHKEIMKEIRSWF